MINRIKYQLYRLLCNITFGKLKKHFFNKKMFYSTKHNWWNYNFTQEDVDFLIEQEKKYPQNIYSEKETIKYIVENKVSCSRIGDGEFLLMSKGKNVVFGNENATLRQELIDICRNGSNEKCLVCINPFHLYDNTSRWFCWYYLKNIKEIYEHIKFNHNNFYGDAYSFWHYSQKIINFNNLQCKNYYGKSFLDYEHVNYISKIWQNKDIVFVCKKNSPTREDKLNLFNNVCSKNYVTVPAEGCYKEYDRIFSEILKFPKNHVIYLECGEVATVLAYKLSSLGYQAIDIGNFYERILNHTIHDEVVVYE